MNSTEYDRLVNRLGNLRENLRQLEDVEYMTALYKGYSSSGLTLNEVNEKMAQVDHSISTLEKRLENENA